MKNAFIIVTVLFSFNLYSQSACVFIPSVNEYATANFLPNGQAYFEINWNNNILQVICENMDSRIEFFNDNMTDPNTGLTYPNNNPNGDGTCSDGDIDSSSPIDFFNDNAFTILVNTIGSKCFWWRIVIESNDCGLINCYSATEWHFIQLI